VIIASTLISDIAMAYRERITVMNETKTECAGQT